MKKHNLWIALVLALGLMLTVGAVYAETHPAPAGPGDVALEFVSYFGGKNEGVAVQGDYAYTGFERAFTVLDISDPAYPTRVGYEILPGAGYITDIELAGDYAYVTIGTVGLAIVDISDPFDPRQVGTCEFPLFDGYPLSVAISDTLAYVGQGDKLRVVDVYTPTHPVEMGAVTINGMSATDVAVAGRYVYVAGRDVGLRVIDVFTPTAPSEVGACTTDIGYATGVDVVGDTAYVSDSAIGDAYSTAMLRVVDISTPSSPTVIGSEEVLLGANADAYGVQVIDAYAYVAGFAPIGAGSYGGLEVVDVSNPTAPDRVTNYVTPDVSSAYDIAVVGEHAFLSTSYSGKFLVVNVSDLSAKGLYEAGRFEVPEDPTDVVAVDDYLYLFDWGLTVIDTSQPKAPRMVGEFEVDPPISSKGSVYVRGDYAYLANSTADFTVVDISDPTDPQGAGSCDVNGRDIAVRGNYAYLPDDVLNVVDITNPDAPAWVGSAPISGHVQAMDISGDYGYVLTDGVLRAYDLTNPTAPQEVGARGLPTLSADVAVSGNYAYVVAYDDQLRILDVSDPMAPAAPLTCTLTGNARWITIAGDYAYIASESVEWAGSVLNRYAVLSVVDISDPTSAQEVATYKAPEDSGEVAYASGDYAYLIGEVTGLYSLRILPLALDVTPGSIFVMAEEGGADPAAQTLEVARASRPLTWTATISPTSATWLSVSPPTGATPATITVDISLTGLSAALSPYAAQIIVESEEPVAGSPQVTEVTLIVAEEISHIYLPVVTR